MEKSTASTNKNPDGLSHPNWNTMIINKICYYFIEMEKVQWNSIDKKQNGLK